MRSQIIAAVAAAFTVAISSAALASDAGVVRHRELLETSKSGGMKVKFTDGSKLDLGADSKAFVVAYIYKPEQKVANAIVSLPAGKMHYLTGDMPRNHTTIYTPTATMQLNGV